MVIHGKYPEVRFFNFSTYAAVGSFVDSALDRDIKPDADSTNPFASPIADGGQDYTLTIGGNAPEAMEHGTGTPQRSLYRLSALCPGPRGGPDWPGWSAGGNCDGRQRRCTRNPALPIHGHRGEPQQANHPAAH